MPAETIAIERSLSPFVTVVDDGGRIVRSSGMLHGEPRTVPIGVLAHVRDKGEEHVTWQPEPGVRVATSIVQTHSAPRRFVIAGRSLQLAEERIARFQSLILLAWGGMLIALALVVGAVNRGSRS